MDNLAKIINGVEEKTGEEFTQQEKTFALNLVKTGNKSEAARLSGTPAGSAGQRGYEMANDPAVAVLIAELSKYSASLISEDMIKSGILKEALSADNSRDRREAFHLLGKTKGLFKDVVEQTVTNKPDDELIAALEKEFGPEAADKARAELGLD